MTRFENPVVCVMIDPPLLFVVDSRYLLSVCACLFVTTQARNQETGEGGTLPEVQKF